MASASKFAMQALLLSMALVIAALPASALSNGMDMSMDGAMSLAAGNMLSYLHFTPGDVLWFEGWVPASARAMVGACIGLFLLAMFERWLACLRSVAEAQWAKEYTYIMASKVERLQVASQGSKLPIRSRFVLSHDIPRGLVHAAQSALELLFMLVAMTFQLAFILSVVVGLGVGEAMFGRYAAYARFN